MLPDILVRYLEDVEFAIQELKGAYIERYEEEILVSNRANMRIRIRFLNGYLLELNEAIVVEAGYIKRLGYRYHFQDKQNNLIFRYDNTPHFPELKNFPHHKHLPDEVIDIEETSVLKIIDETKLLVQQVMRKESK